MGDGVESTNPKGSDVRKEDGKSVDGCEPTFEEVLILNRVDTDALPLTATTMVIVEKERSYLDAAQSGEGIKAEVDGVSPHVVNALGVGSMDGDEWRVVKGKGLGECHAQHSRAGEAVPLIARFGILDPDSLLLPDVAACTVSRLVSDIIAPVVVSAHDSRGMKCKRVEYAPYAGRNKVSYCHE
ncbi:hypothetical protein Dimus_035514 [Dionaea muscipula]